MEYRYLAFDPGGTTGWASVSFDDKITNLQDVLWDRGQMGPEYHHKELYDFISRCTRGVDVFRLITESFEYRNQSRAGLVLDSVQYIGVMNLWAEQNDEALYLQTASMGKGFVKDEHIKKLGLWIPSYRHAMDATRHLIYFIVTNKNVPNALKELVLLGGYK